MGEQEREGRCGDGMNESGRGRESGNGEGEEGRGRDESRRREANKGEGERVGEREGWRGEAARSERGPAACTDARGSPSCPCGVSETRRLRGHQLHAKLVASHPCRLWVCLGF